MRKPYMQPVVKASSDIKIPEPWVSRLVIFLLKLLGRLYLFLFYGVARVVLQGGKGLFEAFARSLAGESRCILAFRHPNGGEPQLLTWFILFKLRRLAAREGVRFCRRPHSVFVYGYEVVRWGGWVARFIMPRVGAMPVHHAKMDSKGMGRIYRALINGPYPLALAPEGQVSYTTEAVPRLEPGAIRIGFHAATRLAEKGESCPVEILPVSVHFRFGSWGRLTMELLLRKIEKASGAGRKTRKLPFPERLRWCRDRILEANEGRYGIRGDRSRSFGERLEAIIGAALETAERMMGVKGEGDFFTRIYHVRQLCWDRIFLPGVESLEGVSSLERGIWNLRAGEAWYAARHQELADLCWYFHRIPLPAADAALHTKIEYTQNLWDFANRSIGGAYSDRISIFPRQVIIQAGRPINLTERLPAYRDNRKSAVAGALAELEKAYLDCIGEVNKTKWD
jgi:hypothetical protein